MHDSMDHEGRGSRLNGAMAGAMGGMTGFLLGAIVGAGVALLLAPAPGNETRRRLRQTARNLGSDMSDAMNRAGDAVARTGEELRNRIKSRDEGLPAEDSPITSSLR